MILSDIYDYVVCFMKRLLSYENVMNPVFLLGLEKNGQRPGERVVR